MVGANKNFVITINRKNGQKTLPYQGKSFLDFSLKIKLNDTDCDKHWDWVMRIWIVYDTVFEIEIKCQFRDTILIVCLPLLCVSFLSVAFIFVFLFLVPTIWTRSYWYYTEWSWSSNSMSENWTLWWVCQLIILRAFCKKMYSLLSFILEFRSANKQRMYFKYSFIPHIKILFTLRYTCTYLFPRVW